MSASFPLPSPQKPVLSDRSYRLLKWTSAFVLPAFSAFYLTLSQLWGLPMAEQVVGTSTALNTLLGGLLAYSTKSYNQSDTKYDGEFEIREGQNNLLTMTKDPEDLGPGRNLNIRIVKKGDVA